MTLVQESSRIGEQSLGNSGRHRVLLVEDHPIVTTGLDRLINYEQDLEVCGTADDFSPALHSITNLKPDLVLLDLGLKGGVGLKLLKRIKTQVPDQKVLVLAMNEDRIDASRAFRAGANGYVGKQQPTTTILKAIRDVLAKGAHLGSSFGGNALHSSFRRGTTVADPLQELTDREREVFTLFGQSKSASEIAQALGLRIKTVESHRTNIKNKLGLRSINALVQQAFQLQEDI